MAIVRSDSAVANVYIVGAQGISYLFALVGRVEPVGAYRYHKGLSLNALEDLGQGHRSLLGQVEVVYGLCYIEVRVGVEPLHESIAMIAEIALYLKIEG